MIKPIKAALLSLCFATLFSPAIYAQGLKLDPTPDLEKQPPREMVEYPTVKLRALDKVTARTLNFEADVGSTFKFGSLYIKVQSCRKTPPVESPESAAFLQIWEVTPKDEAEWVFSGWMFASSPGLSYMDHPIYDVWVLDCINLEDDVVDLPAEEEAPSDEKKEGEGEVEEGQVPDQPNIEVETLE